MSDIVLKALHLITQYFFAKTLRTISILQMENLRQGGVSDLPGLTFKFKFKSAAMATGLTELELQYDFVQLLFVCVPAHLSSGFM